jgi:uncharacterized membrane protein HdeD (DUF308 family)
MSFFVKEGTTNKGVGGLGVILGILFILIGYNAWNPFYLALLIGFWLIIEGISIIFVGPPKLAKTE